jgi:hypothetical protein
MANALVTSTIITNEVLRIAHNTSAFLGNMNTDFDKSWKGQYKPGQTVKARSPVKFTHRTGSTANVQDVTESSVDVTVQPELGIDFAVSSNDLALSIGSDGKVNSEFKRRYLQPAGLKISAMLDYLIAAQVKNNAYQFVGTPGTPPANVSDILNAKVPAQNMGLPPGEFFCALNPTANASVVSGLSTLYNDKDQLAKQYKTGVIKTALGVDFLMSQNLPTHTVGALGGSGAVNGANQGLTNAGATDNPYAATTSLVTNGWSNSITGLLKAGDVITIANVFSVNPETKQSTGALQTFVVTADVNSDGSGNATLVISPAIIAGGAFQNVTARPATSAAITVKTGSANTGYSQNMLWHPDAITFVSPEQELPGGMDMAYQASLADEGSISLRFVRGFDITNNRFISRFDVLWGVAVTRPDWVVRRTN